MMKHLISIDDLEIQDIQLLFSFTEKIKKIPKNLEIN